MRRDPGALRETKFDLLVIGGGVYGAWTAYDAALRGLKVALVERSDWAAGTSSRSSKLIHGGLRYLEHGHLGLVRTTLAERRRLLELAPHRVRPLRFVLPVYRHTRPGRLRLRLGLWLYDRLAGGAAAVGGHTSLGAEELGRRFPFVRREGLTAGFTYGDSVTDDARFVLEVVSGAVGAGAVAVNGMEATAWLQEGDRITGAQMKDRENGDTFPVRAGSVVACTGPWHALSARPHDSVRLTRGVHLVMPPLPAEEAFILMDGARRRVVFLIPWYGRTLLGTTETDDTAGPDQVEATPGDVQYLLETAAGVLAQPWTESDICGRFAGLRVLPRTAGPASSVSREFKLVQGEGGVLTFTGGKYTSARADAARMVDAVMARQGREGACTTDVRPFPWHSQEIAAGVSATVRGQRYGNRLALLEGLLRERPELGEPLLPGLPFVRGEVVFAARHEMARTLEDILRRRMPLLILGQPSLEVIQDAARLAGAELGWSAGRREAEIASVVAQEPVPAGPRS